MKKVPFEQNTKLDLTPEEIEGFKKEFGDVFEIIFDDKLCFIHKPDRMILDAAQVASRAKPSMFAEIILRNCWLAGDKEILIKDDYFYGASSEIDRITLFKTSELKKY